MEQEPKDKTGGAATIPAVFAVLLVVDSLHFVFARALLPLLPPEMASFLMLGIAAVQVGMFQAVRGKIRLRAFFEHWRFYVAIGLLITTSTVIDYNAVAFIDPGTASLLSRASVFFSLAFGLFWLSERLRPNELAGAFIAIVGVVIISFQPGEFLRFGSLLALISSFLYALHTAIVKRYGEGIDFGDFFFFRVATTAFFLFMFTVARGQIVRPSPMGWLIAFLAATVDVVISRSLFYLSLRRIPMSIHTIILTLSPVVTIIWSLVLFREIPSMLGFAGGGLVILGVALVTAWRRP